MANGDQGGGAPANERALGRERTRRRRDVYRRRRTALALLAGAALAAGVAVGAGAGGGGSDSAAEAEASRPTLPRGGRNLLPDHRLVAFYGAPQSDELGALGVGTPAEAGERLLDQADAYSGGNRPVLPVFELIVSVAAADPGDDGEYVLRESDAVIRRYLAEVRRLRGLLLLDVQPGRADFRDEVERLEPYLRMPDVGLALDPEWHVGPTEVPGQVIGSVDAETVNEISAELAATVQQLDLPEKLFVIHQFTPDMIEGRERLRERPGLATVINVDGFGDQPNKIAKYRELHPDRSTGLGAGFKLFYNEDTDLMGPEQVLDLQPKPDLIVYE